MYYNTIDQLMQQAHYILDNIGELEKYVQNIEIETQQLHQFVLNLKDYQDNILAVNSEIINVKQNVKNQLSGVKSEEKLKPADSKAARLANKRNDKMNTNRSSKLTSANEGSQKCKDNVSQIANYEFALQNILEEYRRHCKCLSKVGLKECFHTKLLSIVNEQRNKFKEVAANIHKITFMPD